MLGALSLLAVNAATFAPKAQLLPQLLVHSLGVGFLVKSWQVSSSLMARLADGALLCSPPQSLLIICQLTSLCDLPPRPNRRT